MTRAAISRAVRTARTVRAVIARPLYVPPGHFYSPHPCDADLDRALTWSGLPVPGVDLAEERQLALAARLAPVLAEPQPGPRYAAANRMFGPADAAVYRAMLSQLRPAAVLEIGSGYSTALALDAADAGPGLGDLRVTCVEPFPDRLLGLLSEQDLARITLIRSPVQDVGPAVFDRLGAGDVLFIDSTHVVKAGSDVVWLFLHVLPRLAAGVIVHVHDVFWPFEYPAQPDLVPPPLAAERPGSIWLRKVG
ncbi:MAG TPA: class I SAM-dependent methyltransferase [Streptosporangiaceae bacterium]|nr:class I SAM-dependent methyltransferase [Streptosporangiaceae bacterium]